jgi:succinylglutamic semialdehyde dehydrogenase
MKPERTFRGNYIQGQFQKIADPNGEVASRNPADLGQAKVSVPFSYEHVHTAVSAARIGFSSWKLKTLPERIAHLKKYAEILKKRETEIAEMITIEVGKPLWESRLEVRETLSLIAEWCEIVQATPMEIVLPNAGEKSSGEIRYLPRGVFSVISSANQPLCGPHAHFVPALLYGNTLVLKASKTCPLVGQCIAEVASESGMPAGVFHVIQGDPEVARRLTCHSGVDGVLFTGSHETGMKIQKQLVTDPWKIVVLEMGGKNGIVVWDDCDYNEALYESFYSAFVTTGQRFSSASRILVHEKIFDRFVKDFHALSKKCKVGNPMADGKDAVFMGPLGSEEAMESYLRYQGMAVREGCEEIMRGKHLEREKRGYFVSPSIHIVPNVDPKSVYQKNEVYGPNVAFYKISQLDEVPTILNLPMHQLVTSVYTHSREVYLRILEETKVAIMNWNHPTTAITPRLPISGLYKSGNNRPMGLLALHQCTYPLASCHQSGSFDIADMPAEMPKLEGN